MKKILISVIGLIILVLIIVSAVKGIKIGKLSIYSVRDIKAAGTDLDAKIDEAETEETENYSRARSDIDTAIRNLKQIKSDYETRIAALGGDSGLGITQIEKYKIEYLWNKVGSYAKKEGLRIDLDIQETTISDTYDINFTLQGSYGGITNFLYSIEDDDELNYKVKDFKINPTTSSNTSNTGTTTVYSNTDVLIATFTVENIIINFN